MQPIGERLEEARKRQGISIREAAEATKIRSDFLLNFESNNFEFDLPDVYKVGFLKLYARFLKLDDKLLQADLETALVRHRSAHSRRDNRGESYGRFEISERRKQEPRPAVAAEPVAAPEAEAEPAGTRRERFFPRDGGSDPTLYLKAGLAVVGVVAIFFLLFVLVRLVLSDSSVTNDGPPVVEDSTPSVTHSQPATTELTFTVIGKESTAIRVTASGQVIYQGPIAKGQRLTLTSSTRPVYITSTDIERVEVEVNGRTMGSAGVTGAARLQIQ